MLVEHVVGDVLRAEGDVLARLAGEHAPRVHDGEVPAHALPLHHLAAVLAHDGALPGPGLGSGPLPITAAGRVS